MKVEVAYALPDQQVLLDVDVPENATVQTAIEQSGILQQFPDLDLASIKVGVFSKHATLDTLLRPKDRVEIYRPLIIDPKAARLLRAQKKTVVNR